MARTILILMLTIFAAGCTNDKPRPKGFAGGAEAKALELRQGSYSIHHFVKGDTVYVECFVPKGNFGVPDKKLKDGELFVTVSIDGNKQKRFMTPAFSISGLKTGYHDILLNVHAYNRPDISHKPRSWTVKVD
ncbi:hypothetical protein J9317_08765 [Metabacillus sp. KIGAM252]|uniref:Lipoprotein n=1 Tax=Metabacillus flavus TaxID=2823519 RepID=A0ABS5LDM5_9BACI|nr:hypothetical protein [Metabacillus flavus]MBS2968848.1 hypothetical protein [Metabacillus flavus]